MMILTEMVSLLWHMHYGWMPRIPKSFRLDWFEITTQVATIKAINTVEDALAFLDPLGGCAKMDDAAPIDNSWIGTSKLLHFLNPNIFPIWDGRVAEHFGLKGNHQLKKKGWYLEYLKFIHDMRDKRPEFVPAVQDYFEDKYEYRPSKIRALEIMLFLYSPEGQLRDVKR